MEGFPQQLDYAARPSLKSRLWWRAGWVILLLLIGFIFIRIGPVAWRNLGIVRSQSKCLTYTAPADQIVVSASKSIMATSPEWVDFYARLSPPGSKGQATLFLHERTSRGGNRRLVYLGGTPIFTLRINRGAPMPMLFPTARVFVPGTAARSPREISNEYRWGGSSQGGIRVLGEFFAGQPDPNDPSHFTIRVASDQFETIYDGWLRDDDTVLIEPRPSGITPATTRADRD